MKKLPKITYVLGAGASFNALPVVNELAIIAGCMLTYFDRKTLNSDSYYPKPKFEKTRKLITEVSRHHSIDTLARKIWIKNKPLRGKGEFDEEYQRLKNLITAILYFKQILKNPNIDSDDEFKEFLEKRKSKFELIIDPRYEAFFASILNEDFTIPDNFNFISWNYDFQMERTLEYYQNCKTIKDIGNFYKINYLNFENSDINGQIIKLNGTCLFIDENSQIIDSTEFNDELLKRFIDAISDDTDEIKKICSLIKFAWEKESDISNHHAIASQKIKESDFVVVIGYSFPIFNRQVDIDLFKNFRLNSTKIIIQAPESDVNQYIEQLESIKSGLSKGATSITNLDQFYIPNEFWTQKPESIVGMVAFT